MMKNMTAKLKDTPLESLADPRHLGYVVFLFSAGKRNINGDRGTMASGLKIFTPFSFYPFCGFLLRLVQTGM